MIRKTIVTAVAVAALFTTLHAEKTRIALAPLQAEGTGLAQQQEAMGNYLEQQLLRAKLFTIIAGGELADQLKKLPADKAGALDQAAAVQAGKALRAGRIVWGKLTNAGGQLSFWLKLADPESGELLFSKSAAGTASDENTRREFEKQSLGVVNDLVAELSGQHRGEQDLTITAVSATNVASMDAMSPSDPYVTVTVGDQIVGTTSFKQNKSNPVWNESFQCSYRGEQIQFAFWDRDVTKDEYIGSCTVDGPKDGSYDIVKTVKGQQQKMGTFTVKFAIKQHSEIEEKIEPKKK